MNIKLIAENLVNLAKDEKHIKEIESKGFKINPHNAKDEWEILYLRAEKLLNFYEQDMFYESPYTYNLIRIEIAKVIEL